MKRKVLFSVLALIVTVSLVVGVSFAFFSDTETSLGNTFTAGTLDLQINGGGPYALPFNITNMKPGNQPSSSYLLENVGSISGKLNITSIVVVNTENGIIEPEAEAGDVTEFVGELGDVVNIRLYWDKDLAGGYSAGDEMIYNGYVSNLPSNFVLDWPMAAGATIKLVAVLDWWNTANDNLAQGDTMTIDFTFELKQ